MSYHATKIVIKAMEVLENTAPGFAEWWLKIDLVSQKDILDEMVEIVDKEID